MAIIAQQSRPRPFRHARAVGIVCGLLALVCGAGFVLGANRAAVVHSGRWVVGVEAGCLVIGQATLLVTKYNSNPGAANRRLGVITDGDANGSFAAAWRPFHAGGARESRLLLPLWQPMFVLGLAAAYAFGAHAGVRRMRRGVCSACGYDLSGLASGAGCPECGSAGDFAAGAGVKAAGG